MNNQFLLASLLVIGLLNGVPRASAATVPVTANLVMNLSADTVNPSDSSQVRLSAGDIYLTNWRDQSGLGNNAVQAGTTAQPLYVANAMNGKPAIRFDGSSDYLATSLAQISGAKTIFVCLKRNGTAAGAQISSTGAVGHYLATNGTSETKGRLSAAAPDVSTPSSASTVLINTYIRNPLSTYYDITRFDTAAIVSDYGKISWVADEAGGNYTISSSSSPLSGDMYEVIIYNRALSPSEIYAVIWYLELKWMPGIFPPSGSTPDIRTVPQDIQPPPMLTGSTPAAGRRVKQTTAEYTGSNVYHTLYLPTDWVPGKKYPVIVDYAGNNFISLFCTGAPEDVSLGYGLTEGKGFIWICMPMVSAGSPAYNATSGMGDMSSTSLTLDYCLKTVKQVCEDYGGDPSAVIISGFSRGAMACNYLGLYNDTMADIWLGFIAHSHYDGQYGSWGWPNADQASTLARLNRLNGRSQHYSYETTNAGAPAYIKSAIATLNATPGSNPLSISQYSIYPSPYFNHTDSWVLRPLDMRTEARAWLQNLVKYKYGTHSISGVVTDRNGVPISGVTVQSGFTHFTVTDSTGKYILGGLINSTRTVTASVAGKTFNTIPVTVSGADVTNVNFAEIPATPTVTYNGNNQKEGTVPTDPNSPYKPGATVTVLGNTGGLSRANSTFVGWNTAVDGSGTSYSEGNTFTIAVPLTLYAQWNNIPGIYTWTQPAGNTQLWATGTNWSGGGAPTPVSGDTIDCSTVNLAASTTLTLGADRTAGTWKFADTSGTQTWIIQGGNTVILAGATPTIQVVNNTVSMFNPIGGTDIYKTGAGILNLNSSLSTYTGGTFIKDGSISLGTGNDRIPIGSVVTLGDISTTGTLILGSSGTARNQILGGLSSSGLGGNVIAQGTGSTLTLNMSGNSTFAGVLGGTGTNNNNLTLIKQGSGALTLSGANTYTGTTSVNGGTLVVSGSLANTPVTVGSGATLAGTGSIGGNVTIQNGGRQAFVVATTSGAQATRTISGTLTLSAGHVIDLSSAATSAAGTYTLVTATGGVTGTVGTVNLTGLNGTVSIVGKSLVLNVTAASDYDAWKSSNGLIGGPNDDDDRDGMTNFGEYAFGLNPNSATSVNPVSGLITTSAGAYFNYTRRKPSLSIVTCSHEYSTTLASGSWSQFTPDSVTTNGGDPVEAVAVKIPAALLTNPKLFLRVRATQ